MILPLTLQDICGLNSLPPPEWVFDYEDFLRVFMPEPYFHAFVMVVDGQRIGTGNVLVKDKVGWLANIIIDTSHRGRGLGSEMTAYLQDFLTDVGCETQLLIATQLGEPVYTKMGYRKLTEYRSFDSVTDSRVAVAPQVRTLEEAHRQEVYTLDRIANSEDRTHLLDNYYGRGWGYFSEADRLLGFYLPDCGRGLVIATDATAGTELLKLKHSAKGKRTLLPVENTVGVAYLAAMGLKEGVTSARMVYGKDNKWKPRHVYSYGSGYCG